MPTSGTSLPVLDDKLVRRSTLACLFMGCFFAMLLTGCGGEPGGNAAGEEDFTETNALKDHLDFAERRLYEMGRRAASWKQNQGGDPGDFSGIAWTDIVPERPGNARASQTYDGDRYVMKGWYEARITSRSPLVIEADLEKAPKRATLRVPGPGEEAVTVEMEDR